MLFGLWTCEGKRNHVLRRGQNTPTRHIPVYCKVSGESYSVCGSSDAIFAVTPATTCLACPSAVPFVIYLIPFNDSFQTNFLKIYWTELRQICRVACNYGFTRSVLNECFGPSRDAVMTTNFVGFINITHTEFQ